MKKDVPAPAANPAEAEWVQAELVRSLLRTAGTTQLLGFFLIPVFVAVMWNDSPHPALILWMVCALGVAFARFAVLRKYAHQVIAQGAAEHLAFFERYRMLWPASALVWGLTTLIYFDRAPLPDQFICWLMLAGLGMFSINSLSSHLQTLRSYLDTLTLSALCVMFWRFAVEQQFRGPYYHYWIIALM